MGKTQLFMGKKQYLRANTTKCSNKLKQFVGNLPKNCLSVLSQFEGVGAERFNTDKLTH